MSRTKTFAEISGIIRIVDAQYANRPPQIWPRGVNDAQYANKYFFLDNVMPFLQSCTITRRKDMKRAGI
jgi:hypothetical protein